MPVDGAALQALEKRARQGGTHLGAKDLEGRWRLLRVWPKGGSHPASAASVLLRGLAAELAIAPAPASGGLHLENRVRLGGLELRFLGEGALEGRRPLLVFGFDRMEVRWGERRLFQRALPPPLPGRRPFFALIGAGRSAPHSDQCWLAARGRGGGLALWVRASAQPAQAGTLM